ncbi:MAG: hypothetical protein LOD90_09150, partial [Symbiobacteriaceae bacterium]
GAAPAVGAAAGLIRWGTPPARWVLLATVAGSGVVFLDATTVNVALPAIGTDLGAEVAGLQWVLNASLWASPITWIVLAIVALIAVIVLIATKTDWFKKIWSVAWDWIKNAASKVWNWLKDLPRKIGDAFGKVRDLITAPFKAAFNTIASLWNRSVGKLSFSVPSWVPGIGGKSFSMPQLPKLARGGRILESGMAIVGERGPELVHLPQGATVAPLDRAGGGPQVLELHLDLGEGIRQVVVVGGLSPLGFADAREGQLLQERLTAFEERSGKAAAYLSAGGGSPSVTRAEGIPYIQAGTPQAPVIFTVDPAPGNLWLRKGR